MSAWSDSSLPEDRYDLVEEYENRESGDELNRVDNAEEDIDDRNNEDDEAAGSNARRVDPTIPKRIVRNPQPKLDTERLKGPKGILTLEKYFEDFKFHGEGHEKYDLDRIMKRIEHWAHRLFPKLEYNDFLGKMETLGRKKDLQVFVKKYRMDMITADDDTSLREIIDDEEEEQEGNVPPQDEFDILLEEQIEKQKQAMIRQESRNNSTSENAFNRLLMASNTQHSEPRKENPPTELSEEVKARIERNRQQAIERRQARLKQLAEEAERKKMKETENMEQSQETIEASIPTS